MSYFKLSTLLFSLLFCPLLFANPTLFHFTDSQGKEVSGYAYEESYSDVRYTFFARQGGDAATLIHDFAEAVMQKRTYYYSTADCPTEDCHVDFRGVQTKSSQKGSAAKGGTKKFAQSDAPNRVLENIATEMGSRVAGNLVDRWFENSTEETSPVTVIYDNSSGAPVGICAMTAAGCEFLSSDKVVFTNLDNGWTATYEYPDTTQPDYEFNSGIADAIERFIRYSQRSRKLSCRTVFTGSGDDLKPQVICYYSY